MRSTRTARVSNEFHADERFPDFSPGTFPDPFSFERKRADSRPFFFLLAQNLGLGKVSHLWVPSTRARRTENAGLCWAHWQGATALYCRTANPPSRACCLVLCCTWRCFCTVQGCALRFVERRALCFVLCANCGVLCSTHCSPGALRVQRALHNRRRRYSKVHYCTVR